MSTDDQFPVNDIDALRALILGNDDAALRSVSDLTKRVGTVEDLLRQDPVTVERLQSLLGEVLHGLEGDERRLVQDRLTGLLLANIQNEIKAAKPEFVQAIYPVAGGLVRKGIQQALAELLELIEERLSEPATFYKRARIRFESLITGKPEAEIWLRQTGLFHVDRILMVDRASGTVITGLRQGRDGTATDTVHSTGSIQGEDQIVSGMLTAIMSFSQEAFGEGDGGGGELSTLEFENSHLHVKATPLVLLVVRTVGTPPAKINSIIENRFDRMVTDNADALASFDGRLPQASRLEIQAQLRRLLRELRKAESDSISLRKQGPKRPFMTFIMALGGVILAALLVLAVLNAVRINNNVTRVQNSIEAVPSLQSYPIDADYERSKASIVVRGLVPDAASAGMLETQLRDNHPRLALSFALSNIATDAVRPILRGPRIEREANSAGVNQLRDEAFIRDTIILDLEQQISDLRQSMAGSEAVSAANSYPALTYDLDPDLGALRDQVGGSLLSAFQAMRYSNTFENEFSDLFADNDSNTAFLDAHQIDEQTVAGTLVGFTAAGSFTDVELAREATRLVAELMATKPFGTRLELLTIARPVIGRNLPQNMEQFIASKTRALLIAQGVAPENIYIRTGGNAAPVAEIDPSTWRKSHYVGFRLAY